MKRQEKEKDKRVSFRVSDSAYDAIEARAKLKGLTVTAYVRMLALDDAQTEVARG